MDGDSGLTGDIIDESLETVLNGYQTSGLIEAYTEQHRHYHDLSHIRGLLRGIPLVAETYELDEAQVVQLHLIAWFHDVIYNVRSPRGENEFESAVIYAYQCNFGLFTGEVYDAIRGTAHHTKPPSFIAAIFYDLDLWGLGAPWPEYQHNGENIRHEYDYLSDQQWNEGRKFFLLDFSNRNRIYHTSWGASRELQAKANLQRELRELL